MFCGLYLPFLNQCFGFGKVQGVNVCFCGLYLPFLNQCFGFGKVQGVNVCFAAYIYPFLISALPLVRYTVADGQFGAIDFCEKGAIKPQKAVFLTRVGVNR